jgi:flagellar biosynthesis/type III secretory pathway protein FliH
MLRPQKEDPSHEQPSSGLLRRGFILGYRTALRRARKDLDRLAANFDAEIANLQHEARKELHSLAASFSAEIGNAIARRVDRQKINRAIQEAADERATIPDAWLH